MTPRRLLAPPAAVPSSPPPGAVEADRARTRRMISGIATAALSRGAGVVVPLVMVPAALAYVGSERYGLWMAVTALTGMAAFADLGLGNGLMTKLAPCYTSGDAARARGYIASAYLVLTGIAAVATLTLWLAAGSIHWDSLFNTDGAVGRSEAGIVAVTCLTFFVVNIPLSLVNRVQYAYQQVGRSNIWQGVGAALGLPLALGAIGAGLPPAVVIGGAVAGPVLGNVANTAWTFGRRMPELAPWRGRIDRQVTRELLRLGGLFFALTVVMSLAMNADPLIVAHRLGLASVTDYSVPARLFAQVAMVVTIVNVPLWTINGDALAAGRLDWVRRTARRMTLVSVVSALVPSVLLVVAGERAFAMWLGQPLGGTRWLLVGLATWVVLLAAISPRFMVQNAAGVLAPQLGGWLLYLIVSMPAKWYGVRWYGIEAVPFAAVGCYLVTVLPAALYGYRLALRRQGGAAAGHRTGGPSFLPGDGVAVRGGAP
ncbi:lipopolysaccharide biosynthesis protein [Micromonospora sp. WMMD1128]|uniref:lipopolysaccharide biosynthesis protein n=1 Tax=Micromonospora sp. WMMD1128 TaxID=3015150 RepID=UPI00248B73F5|nr:lipopolysaccharide biosynthesis protein [Micromonospora sp. WMMD1128]WBB71736.1 lipopolysaccharide biosynthesis protein [Micromonospora sp. WMMD1128]